MLLDESNYAFPLLGFVVSLFRDRSLLRNFRDFLTSALSKVFYVRLISGPWTAQQFSLPLRTFPPDTATSPRRVLARARSLVSHGPSAIFLEWAGRPQPIPTLFLRVRNSYFRFFHLLSFLPLLGVLLLFSI